jgi:hypothetical protein
MTGDVKAIVNLANMLFDSEECLSDIREVCQKSPLMTTIVIVNSFLQY